MTGGGDLGKKREVVDNPSKDGTELRKSETNGPKFEIGLYPKDKKRLK